MGTLPTVVPALLVQPLPAAVVVAVVAVLVAAALACMALALMEPQTVEVVLVGRLGAEEMAAHTVAAQQAQIPLLKLELVQVAQFVSLPPEIRAAFPPLM